jgi:hypothetical protein
MEKYGDSREDAASRFDRRKVGFGGWHGMMRVNKDAKLRQQYSKK